MRARQEDDAMREDHAMTAKLIALAFVLSAAASSCLAAEAPGRYTMTTVEGSVWQLGQARLARCRYAGRSSTIGPVRPSPTTRWR